ncbi:AraC family transcriptional regulator [Myroides odoratus]|uniref:helix-turn-helix domain-containing protein n=1 Tax=Myroides odoratus TaxID=256 RepID=UPI003342441B
MKSLLFLFLTVIAWGECQLINFQQAEIYRRDEGVILVQSVENSMLINKIIGKENRSLTLDTNQPKETSIFRSIQVFSIENTTVVIGSLFFLVLLLLDFFRWIIQYCIKRVSVFTYQKIVANESCLGYFHAMNDCCVEEQERRYITLKKEIAILKQIEDSEKELFYLDKSISINALAAKFAINHRYLSYVINKHKKCDFATYVNQLRVMYIVNCLQNKPKYLQYKISYLADQSGFASHSRFTINFKKFTGHSPSTFINNLKKEKMFE